MALYTTKQRDAIVKRAMAAVEARIAGKTTYRAGGQTFNLEERGYCGRFVRQCFETALGFGAFEWRFGAETARKMGSKMGYSGFLLADGATLQPGDVLVWDDQDDGRYGHIVLYVGDYYGDGRKLVAENTSGRRGYPLKPGTKISRLSAVHGGKGYDAYRMFPTEVA